MAVKTSKAEHVIENLAGCGLFQVSLMMILFPAVKTLLAYSTMFMAFGSYNPGWRCMDNVTGSILTNDTSVIIKALGGTTTTTMTTTATAATGVSSLTETDDTESDAYVFESCDLFEKCSDVEFNPTTATIVSEWGLICDKAWIVKMMISIQMLGMLLGSYISGQVSDVIGRKKTLWIGVASSCVCHLISSFSVSWEMFLVLRLALGMCCTISLVDIFIYVSEFMTRKWRAVITAFPIWYVGATLMAFSAWIFKDWRNVDLLACILNAVCLIIIIWVPESLRWLEVKKHSKEFTRVSRKVLRYNRKPMDELESMDLSMDDKNVDVSEEKKEDKKYTVLDLFRKGYRLITFCILFLQFSLSLLYYALSFGAKSLYGNFYLNLFVFNAIPIPFGLTSMLILRAVRRRTHTVIFIGFSIACAVVSVAILLSGDETAKNFGSTILISISKGALDGAWLGIYARNAELYPTVVRGLGVGVGSLSARLGGIIAPLLIPNDKSVLYIFMIIMSVVAVFIGLVSLKLPETKGKILRENFDGDEEREAEVEA